MKKYFSTMLILAVILSLAFFSNNIAVAQEKPVKIVVSTVAVKTHPMANFLAKINEKLKEMGSSVILDNQLGGVLGGERENAESTMLGTIDASLVADLSVSALEPKVTFASFPGMFRNYKEVQEKYYKGWVGQKIKEFLAPKNITVLQLLDNDFRIVTNSKKPVTKIDDLKGLKLRVPEVSFLVDFFKEVGTLATPIAIGELVTALQQKVVDGQELGPTVVYSFGLYKFQKYQTMTNHSYSAMLLMINTAKWNSLTKKQQTELQTAVNYAGEYYSDFKQKFIADAIVKMKAAGCEIIEPGPKFQQDIMNVGKKMARSDKYMKLYGKEIVDKMYPQGK